MKLSLLLLMPLLIKSFIITHNNNMPAITIANDEIICRYFSFTLFRYIESTFFDPSEENQNAFIIKKKAEYSCGIQIKRSLYNKAVGRYLNYDVFQLTAIRKEKCNNNKAVTFCDHGVDCDEYRNNCCKGDFCNDYNNINFTKGLYLFDTQKFLNSTTHALCYKIYNIDTRLPVPGIDESINGRKNTTCFIIEFKQNALSTNNIINRSNKITSVINLAENEIICNFCVFPVFSSKQNYNKEYKEHCENMAFIITNKSKYYCGFQGVNVRTNFAKFSTIADRSLFKSLSYFEIGAIKKNECRTKNYAFMCDVKIGVFNNQAVTILCCQKNNCNSYNNIMFSTDIYSTYKNRFLKNTSIEDEKPPTFSYPGEKPCTFMKFNTTKINELAAIKDKSENTNKNMCDCNNQDNLVSSYANLLILVLSTFFYNNN
jgi:hypothetical protein